ncbi:MAG: hypothetical protein HQK54_12115 [Oligoflexales bacterium]|nr:hypothetical protein [Oligoflexales bacterium]
MNSRFINNLGLLVFIHLFTLSCSEGSNHPDKDNPKNGGYENLSPDKTDTPKVHKLKGDIIEAIKSGSDSQSQPEDEDKPVNQVQIINQIQIVNQEVNQEQAKGGSQGQAVNDTPEKPENKEPGDKTGDGNPDQTINENKPTQPVPTDKPPLNEVRGRLTGSVPSRPDLAPAQMPGHASKTYQKTAEFSNDFTIHLGYEGKVLEVVRMEASYNLTLSAGTEKSLLLIKSAPTGTERMVEAVKKDENTSNGENGSEGSNNGYTYRPYLADGLPYIGMCLYTTKSSITQRMIGSVKISGNGFTNRTDFSNSAQVSVMSEVFRITEDDTVPSLLNRCLEVYEAVVAKNAKKDLTDFLLAELQFDNNSKSAERMIIDAALFGPRLPRIKYKNMHWNINKASITKENGILKISGRFEHSIRGMSDDLVDYRCEYSNDSQTAFDVKFRQRSTISNYRGVAREIADLICRDASIEFRDIND